MWTQQGVWLAQEHAQEMQQAAQRRSRVRELLQERRAAPPVYASLLDQIGHILIEAGLNLRARYGTLDAYADAAPSLATTGQHS